MTTPENPEPDVRMPMIGSALYAEIEAADALARNGFEVHMHGGHYKLTDGTADRRDLRLDVQVKGTSKITGAVDWRKDGSTARAYADYAEAAGRTAVFLFVHAEEVSEAYIAEGEIRFPRPTVTVYATTARQFAEDVDAERALYAEGLYQRGPNTGQHRSPDGCAHPVYATNYPTLDDLLAGLS